MSHVAAVSWAETQQPETRLAIHSPTKTRFLSANQVDVFCRCSVAMAMKRTQESRSQEVRRSQDQHPHSESRRLILQLLSAAAAPGRPFSDVQQGLNPRSEPYLSSHHLAPGSWLLAPGSWLLTPDS